MPSGRTVKLLLYEVLEFACLCVPVFVVLERFASLMRIVKYNNLTAYWLVVAASIAYVTSMSLLVWLPLKFFILKSKWVFKDITSWRPVALTHVLLCILPCFAILIASSKVQIETGIRYDTFTELPVSLVLFSIICVDIVERIRPFPLTGQAGDLDSDIGISGPVLTHMEQVSSVSAQLQAKGDENGSVTMSEGNSASTSRHWGDVNGTPRSSNTAYLYSSRPQSGSLLFFCVRDPRHEFFVDTFMFWLDTVEMVRMSGISVVYYSNWVFPIYILTFFSILRVVLTPKSPAMPSLGVLTQDIPFLVIRICLISIFGYVTPVLYIMKNLLVCLTFVYFLHLTKLKVFNRGRMF